jgi:hypothetical protein
MKRFIVFLVVLFAIVLTSKKSEANTCGAWTYCPNMGFTVRCETYGYGCSWYVQPYQYVRCTGLDFFGNWVVVTESCFR